jgi:DDE superfamily endonuclease
MTPAQLRRVRTRLLAFAEDIFGSIPRKDQRRWGQTYLRGLLLDGKRKSIEPMAARLTKGDPDPQADAYALEQALQQFVNQSPWDPTPVRRRLAERMTAAIQPTAWVIDDTAFPKFGRYSVGVAPQYCGALGKVANCQVGVSIHAATDQASCPLDWRLFLPESWDDDAERRRKAHVPDAERHRPKWQLALELLDELVAWDLLPPVVLADAADGEVSEFRLGLEQRELAYVVQVPGTISAYPEHITPSRSPTAVAGGGPWRATASAARRCGSWCWPPARRRPRRSPGAKAPTANSWPRGLSPCGCARPGSGCAVPPQGASCRCAGCSLSGQTASPSRSSTGWPPCPRPPPCSSSCTWPSCAGEWSTITGSSKTRWGWTTSRAAPSRAGIIT